MNENDIIEQIHKSLADRGKKLPATTELTLRQTSTGTELWLITPKQKMLLNNFFPRNPQTSGEIATILEDATQAPKRLLTYQTEECDLCHEEPIALRNAKLNEAGQILCPDCQKSNSQKK